MLEGRLGRSTEGQHACVGTAVHSAKSLPAVKEDRKLALTHLAAYAHSVMRRARNFTRVGPASSSFFLRRLTLALVGFLVPPGRAHETVAERQLKSLEDQVSHDTAERDRVDPRLDPARNQAEEQARIVPFGGKDPPPLPIRRTVDVTAAAQARQAESDSALSGRTRTTQRRAPSFASSGVASSGAMARAATITSKRRSPTK